MTHQYPDGTGEGTWYPEDGVTVRFRYRVDAHGIHLLGYDVATRTGHKGLSPDALKQIAGDLHGAAEASYGIELAKLVGQHAPLGSGTLILGEGEDRIAVDVADLAIVSWSQDAADRVAADARGRRQRRTLTPALLQEIADVYAANPQKPTKAVREKWVVSDPTASRWVKAARDAGLIPPRP